MGIARNIARLVPNGSGELPTANIAAGAIVEADIANLAVTAGKLASTLDLSSKTLTLPSSSVREYQQVSASTTTDRSLAGDSGWVTHLTVTFTTTQTCTVMCFANFAHGREDGPVQLAGRFTLDGSTSTEDIQVFKQGFASSYAFGAHSSMGFFTSVSAGSHTITLQVRNSSSGSTAIMNHWDNPGGNNAIGDRMYVLFK
jgi:hypothetical protein